jgi:hypothetical protein
VLLRAHGTPKLYLESDLSRTIEDCRRAVELAPLDGVYRGAWIVEPTLQSCVQVGEGALELLACGQGGPF